jgi:hypothetical protein
LQNASEASEQQIPTRIGNESFVAIVRDAKRTEITDKIEKQTTDQIQIQISKHKKQAEEPIED